jgi:hypothetical protein
MRMLAYFSIPCNTYHVSYVNGFVYDGICLEYYTLVFIGGVAYESVHVSWRRSFSRGYNTEIVDL